MAKVLCIHRQEPNWTATPEQPRYEMIVGGTKLWVETDGGKPSLADVQKVLHVPRVKSPLGLKGEK